MNDADCKEMMVRALAAEAAANYRGADATGPFSDEEDARLLVARSVFGNRWLYVAEVLPGR